VSRRLRWALTLLAVPVAAALFSGLIPASWYTTVRLDERLRHPSLEHPFGTDELGRDVFLRAAVGARRSLLVGLVVVLGSSALGLLAGGLAGYLGGPSDRLLTFFSDLIVAFPGILFALALVALAGPGLASVTVALIMTGWVGYARLARSLAMGLRSAGFIEAQRAIGSSAWRILSRHMFPPMSGALVVIMTLHLPAVVVAEGALSFLGMGAQPPDPSWGTLMDEARRHLVDGPFLALLPGLLLALTLLGTSLLGEWLSVRLDSQHRRMPD